jgi:hypothetical protein
MPERKSRFFISRSSKFLQYSNFYSEQEKLLRLKDEEIFSLSSERMSLTVDLKNARLTESLIKEENHQLNQKRIDSEQSLTE